MTRAAGSSGKDAEVARRFLDGRRRAIPLGDEQVARIPRLLPEGTWGRSGVHSETGLATPRRLVPHAVRHQEHHLGSVAEKRRALGVSGPEESGR